MKDLLTEFERSLETFFFEKCKFSLKRCIYPNEMCDYSVYITSFQRYGNEEVNSSHLACRLFEEAKSWILKIKDVQTSGDYLFIYLNRQEGFSLCFNEVLQNCSKYGMNTLFLGKRLLVTADLIEDPPTTLTKLRIKLSAQILKKVLITGCAIVIDDHSSKDVNEIIHVSQKSFQKFVDSDSCKFILVAPVLNDNHTSPADYKRKRKENLMLLNDVNSSLSDQDQESLIDAVVLFDLFKSKLSKPVKLVDQTERDRGAVFSIYNYARLRLILDKFDEKSAEGIYPKLPKVEDVDFSLLVYEDEWRLVFGHILAWPSVISGVVKSLIENNDCRIHLLINFLHSLSGCVSSYYSRIQILTEPRPQLLPYLFVRIYLLKIIIIVMDNCFAILRIKPLLRM